MWPSPPSERLRPRDLRGRRRGVRVGCLPLLGLLVVAVLGGAVAVRTQCVAPHLTAAGGASASPAAPPVPPDLFPDSGRRAEESTYLTFPEWYIVYSAEEYARWIEAHPPSGFPYFRSVGQYWCGYNAVFELTRQRYGFNAGDHLMLVVIGTSYTAEYGIRGAYENTVGRLTEWLSDGGETEEDPELWRQTGTWGAHPIRKWERKLALSAEYAGKAAYGWLIGLATGAVYSPDETQMLVWAENGPASRLARDSAVRTERAVDAQSQLVVVPRFTAFTRLIVATSPAPGEDPGRLLAVAGNRELMLTAIAPRAWRYDLAAGSPIFEQAVLTDPDKKRIAVSLPVADLLRIVSALQQAGVTIEHIYDY